MNQYFNLAIHEAKTGAINGHGGPFGAVIVKNNKIISRAHNMVVSSKDPTAHAEILAIRKAAKKLKSFNLKNCTLYTTSEPCPMCLAAILWAGIKKVHYACTIQDAKKIGFKDSDFYKLLKSKKINKQLVQDKKYRILALQVFKEWFNKKNRIKY